MKPTGRRFSPPPSWAWSACSRRRGGRPRSGSRGRATVWPCWGPTPSAWGEASTCGRSTAASPARWRLWTWGWSGASSRRFRRRSARSSCSLRTTAPRADWRGRWGGAGFPARGWVGGAWRRPKGGGPSSPSLADGPRAWAWSSVRHRATGHVPSSPAGSSRLRNAQPITANTARGPIAIAHNGNLTNAEALRREMERDGAIFQSNSDTEVTLPLLARAPAGTLVEQLPHALRPVTGAYSLLILTPDAMYAVRDPNGFRPLGLGRFADSWVIASAT